MEEAVNERCKAFAAAHRSNENRQVISSLLDVPHLSLPSPWQATCFSLSPKSNPKSVYSLLCSVAGSPFSSSSSPNFLNCSSFRESASVFGCYLRFHFSVSVLGKVRSVQCGEPEATFPSFAEAYDLRSLT